VARLSKGYKHPSEPVLELRGDEWYVPPEELPGWQIFNASQKHALRILPMCENEHEVSLKIGRNKDWLNNEKQRVPSFKAACKLRLLVKAHDRLSYFLAEAEVVSAMMLHKTLYDSEAGYTTTQVATSKWFIERRDRLLKSAKTSPDSLDGVDGLAQYSDDQVDSMLEFTVDYNGNSGPTTRQLAERAEHDLRKAQVGDNGSSLYNAVCGQCDHKWWRTQDPTPTIENPRPARSRCPKCNGYKVEVYSGDPQVQAS
jgi:hypothetical protein